MPDARSSENAGASDGGSELTSPAPIRFSLRKMLAVIGACACAAGILAWIRDANVEAERLRHRRELERSIPIVLGGVGQGLHNYGGVHFFDRPGARKDRPWPPVERLDDQGRVQASWRLEIGACVLCMCVDHPAPNLKQPWDSQDNLTFANHSGVFFILDREKAQANVFGVTGPGSAFDSKSVSHYDELPGHAVVAMEIRDSNTKPMQPGDYDVTELLSQSGRIGDHLHGLLPDRFHVLFADGEVWALSPDAPMTALHPFLTIAEAKAHDRDKLLAPHCLDKRLPLGRDPEP